MEKITRLFWEKYKVFKKFLKPFGKEIQKDIRFYLKNTEVFAIFTILYHSVITLFILAIQSNVILKLLLLTLSLVITFVITFLTILYLHALKYDTYQFATNTHGILNKSFKVRRLFLFLKSIPVYVSLTIAFVKRFKHLRLRLAFQ